ncbi:hypothetical protein ZIOFF_012096 [Zingiber officinale]|uniref:Epidermal patterning factor-like protein n=2 Tax=Zingiber officinale TaxID=94328 RepID=A0A8J5I6V6_ZINOF|nr:hypothetical protein ZIOFF_012096 [Zingiber officinale]
MTSLPFPTPLRRTFPPLFSFQAIPHSTSSILPHKPKRTTDRVSMDHCLRHHRRRLVLFLFLAGVLSVGTMAKERRPLARAVVRPSSRNRLLLVGSSPPACLGRCGGCAPCRAVLVVIHPGSVPPENYYPQAWRCECHNKLFQP